MLDLVAGLKHPSFGSVYVDNAPPSGRTDIGFIFQKDNCLPWLTVEKNLTFGLDNVDPQHVEHTLEVFELKEKREVFPHRLSGGEQQRVAMARLALMNAGVVLCDEPFSSIDSVKRQGMWDRLRALVTNNEATALVVTHEPQEAFLHADFVCVLLKGPMRVCASFTLNDGFRQNFELQRSAQAFYVAVLKSGACADVPDCLHEYTEQNVTSIESLKTATAGSESM